jgi:hypothetical protein
MALSPRACENNSIVCLLCSESMEAARPIHSPSVVHVTAAIDFACPWCAVSTALVRSLLLHQLRLLSFSSSLRLSIALTTALQLHSHLQALSTSRPSVAFNVIYLPRILFPCGGGSQTAPTPCMLTAEVSRALQGILTILMAGRV